MELTKSNFTSVDKEERKNLDFKAGDTIRVWSKIQEKGKTRLQAFEGLVLSRKHGKEAGATFTVRKIASGVGVERIFPLYSPNIGKVEILKKAKTRRNKLYYIRTKAVKEVRKRLKSITLTKDTIKKMSGISKTPEIGEKAGEKVEEKNIENKPKTEDKVNEVKPKEKEEEKVNEEKLKEKAEKEIKETK